MEEELRCMSGDHDPSTCQPETNGNTNCEEDHKASGKETWSNTFEFMLTLVGYCVGYGNLWRFSILCMRNGGGAFLIPFFLLMAVFGIPLFFLELSVGQFSGKGPVGAWKSICPLFQGLGVLMVIISSVAWYFTMIIAWVLYYLVWSFFPVLPWASCDNWWNSDHCVTIRGSEGRVTNASAYNITGYNNTDWYNASTSGNLSRASMTSQTAATEFWEYNVLRRSSGLDEPGTVLWHLVVSVLVAWILIFLCLINGVRSVGKVVYVTALAPYVLLTVFLIRGLTLDGAADGIAFYLKPDFSKLLNFQVWVEAAVQVFYSLGPSWGGLITFSSCNKFNSNCLRVALIGTAVDAVTSLYAGLPIFAMLGVLALEAGVSVEELATSGPGLTFVICTEAMSRMPLPNLWAVLFFFMMLTVGLDSMFGNVETVVCGIMEIFPRYLANRKRLLLFGFCTLAFVCELCFTTNGGVYLFLLVDWYLAAYAIVLGALLESIIIGWIYGAARFSRDIELMIGRPVPAVIRVCWCLVCPVVMLTLFVVILINYKPPSYDNYQYPVFGLVIGNMFAIVSVLPLPIMMCWGLLRTKGSLLVRIKRLLQSTKEWGPNSVKLQKWYRHNVYRPEGGVLGTIKANLCGSSTTPDIPNLQREEVC